MTFGQTIQRLRLEAKLSQQEVAEALGLARATYMKLESAAREPKLDELQKISSYYEISLQDLVDGQINKINQTKLTIEILPQFRTDDNIQPREIDPKYKPDKLRQVLLYVLNKVGGKPNVGETVLYKLLYFIDFDYYEKYGKSITGLRYYHNHYGPTPGLMDFEQLTNDMQAKGELEIISTKFFNNLQKKYLAVKEMHLNNLSAQEIKHIDEELERLSNKNAKELTDLSHKDAPWMMTKPNQLIDYRDTFYRTEATSVTELDDEL